MKPHQGRRAVIATGILVIAAIAGAGIFARGPLIEQWYINRLRSEDEDTRLAAARKLADLKSLAAVPHLVRVIKDENRVIRFDTMGFTSGETICLLPPLYYALYRIGAGAPESVKKKIRENFLSEDGNLLHLAPILEAWDLPTEDVQEAPTWSCTAK